MPGKHDPYRLMKYVAVSAGDGIAFGWVLLLVLLRFDIAGLGALVHGSDSGTTAVLLLAHFFAITFGMVGIAWRVMVMLPDEE